MAGVVSSDCELPDINNGEAQLDVAELLVVDEPDEIAEIKELLALKKTFVRYISHELRTPLNTVSMGLRLIENIKKKSQTVVPTQRSISAKDNHFASVIDASQMLDEVFGITDEINASCDVAVDILNDILLVESIDRESGALMPTAQKLEPAVSLTRRLVKSIQSVLSRRMPVSLTFSIDRRFAPEEPNNPVAYISVDEIRLAQVLRKLITAAIKLIPDDSPTKKVNIAVTLSSKPTSICDVGDSASATASNAVSKPVGQPYFCVNISVPDQSISPKDMQLMRHQMKRFDPNLLVGESSSAVSGPLGLYIANVIVRSHNGFINIRGSRDGKGTTFSINLPLRRAADNDDVKENQPKASKDVIEEKLEMHTGEKNPRKQQQQSQSHIMAQAERMMSKHDCPSKEPHPQQSAAVSHAHPGNDNECWALPVQMAAWGRMRSRHPLPRQSESVAASDASASSAQLSSPSYAQESSPVVGEDVGDVEVPPPLALSREITVRRSAYGNTLLKLPPGRDVDVVGAGKSIGTMGFDASTSTISSMNVPSALNNTNNVLQLSLPELRRCDSESDSSSASRSVLPPSRCRAASASSSSSSSGETIRQRFQADEGVFREPLNYVDIDSDDATTNKPAPRELRVLVVDDSKATRKMMVRYLKTTQMCGDIVEAENGEEALRAVEGSLLLTTGTGYVGDASNGGDGNLTTGKTVASMSATSTSSVSKPFDCILIDFVMPVMDGPTAVNYLRTKLDYRGLIIGVTGNILSEDVQHFKAMGADFVVGKPVDSACLAALFQQEFQLSAPNQLSTGDDTDSKDSGHTELGSGDVVDAKKLEHECGAVPGIGEGTASFPLKVADADKEMCTGISRSFGSGDFTSCAPTALVSPVCGFYEDDLNAETPIFLTKLTLRGCEGGGCRNTPVTPEREKIGISAASPSYIAANLSKAFQEACDEGPTGGACQANSSRGRKGVEEDKESRVSSIAAAAAAAAAAAGSGSGGVRGRRFRDPSALSPLGRRPASVGTNLSLLSPTAASIPLSDSSFESLRKLQEYARDRADVTHEVHKGDNTTATIATASAPSANTVSNSSFTSSVKSPRRRSEKSRDKVARRSSLSPSAAVALMRSSSPSPADATLAGYDENVVVGAQCLPECISVVPRVLRSISRQRLSPSDVHTHIPRRNTSSIFPLLNPHGDDDKEVISGVAGVSAGEGYISPPPMSRSTSRRNDILDDQRFLQGVVTADGTASAANSMPSFCNYESSAALMKHKLMSLRDILSRYSNRISPVN